MRLPDDRYDVPPDFMFHSEPADRTGGPFDLPPPVDPSSDLTEAQKEILTQLGRERLEAPDALTGTIWQEGIPAEFMDPRAREALRHKHHRVREYQDRQDRFLNAIAEGHTIHEACALVGIQYQTYSAWKSPVNHPHDYKEFRQRFKLARKQGELRRFDINEAKLNPNKMSFEMARKYVFGRDTYPYQSLLVQIIEDAPEGEITMILLPPSVGKTMTIEDWLAIEIGKDHSLRCIYISESDDLPEKSLLELRNRMLSEDIEYHRYQSLYGPFRDPENPRQTTFRKDRMRILGAMAGMRDYTIQAKGWDSQIYSMRADIIVLDDVQTDRSLSQTNKMLQRLRRTVLNRREGALRGKVIYIGTRIGVEDLPGKMIAEGMVDPACLFVLPLINTGGTSNFEETIPTSSLPLIVKQAGDEFQAIFQQNPTGKKGKTFGPVIDKIKDKERTVGENLSFLSEQDVLGRITAVDPALDGGNATLSLAWNMEKIWVTELDVSYELGRMSAIEEIIEWQILNNASDLLIVETKAFQKALGTSESLHAKLANYAVRLHQHETGINKTDRNLGVAAMEFTMNAGGISVPWGDDFSKDMFAPLISQLNNWDPNVPTKALIQDAVMALWFPWHWVTLERRRRNQVSSYMAQVQASNDGHGRHRHRGLPYAKTTLRHARS